MRNFPDFLDAYLEYSSDSFCPEKFHFWTGISVIAGALERRTWIHRGSFNLYPNLYIMLISKPGVGKSSAGNIGVYEFLSQVGNEDGSVNFLAVQSSEASFLQQMASWKAFDVEGRKHTHSSSFLYASEASNSLKEMVGGGSITAALTEFYDCPSYWKKQLVKENVEVRNGCCNLLAGCTFAHLKKLVPREEAEGGFASRLLYIVQDEVLVRSPKWKAETREEGIREKLLADLQDIFSMKGAFSPSDEFISAYETWFPKQDLLTQSMKSERLQHFLARKHTNLLKLAMICSASESNDRKLKLQHWERAMELIEGLEEKLPKVVDGTTSKETQGGVTYHILKAIEENGGTADRMELMSSLIGYGINAGQIEPTLNLLKHSGKLGVEVGSGGQMRYRFSGNSQDYL